MRLIITFRKCVIKSSGTLAHLRLNITVCKHLIKVASKLAPLKPIVTFSKPLMKIASKLAQIKLIITLCKLVLYGKLLAAFISQAEWPLKWTYRILNMLLLL